MPLVVFDGEIGIALHAMKWNRASSGGEGEVSWFFSSCGGNLEYILELWQGWPFKTRVCSAMKGLLSSYEGHLRNILKDGLGSRDAARVEAGDPVSISSFHRDIEIAVNFQDQSSILTV